MHQLLLFPLLKVIISPLSNPLLSNTNIRIDNILFNSGKGAVFNAAGKVNQSSNIVISTSTNNCPQNELETSIMLSKPPASHPEIPPSRRGFGLTLLTHIRNPSQLARLLYLTPSAAPHVFLSGANAESIAEDLGVELVDPSYFFSEARWKEHRRGLGLPDTPYPPGSPHSDGEDEEALDLYPTGTVGAVALDIRGCICAVTSTGGRTNKLVGRIGDTPSMASGFWAEEWETKSWLRKTWNKIKGKGNKLAVGISGTGDGDVWRQLLTRTNI